MELLTILEYYGFVVNGDGDKIVCPFHGDINASLQVNPSQNFWYCYGCCEHGNAYDFHRKMQEQSGNVNEIKVGLLYNKILNKKAKKSKVLDKQVVVIKKDRKYYRQMLIEAKDYYYGLKSCDWTEENRVLEEAKDYMEYRGFRLTMLNRIKAKYTYKDFSYPIIFPILDNGKFKGYVKRTFSKFIEDSRKYMYNAGFRRRTTIAGTYKDSVVMIVEGYLDMLKAKQSGVKNVGAILGWKITNQQVKKLKSAGVTHIICATDNDEKGKEGYKYLKSLKEFKVIRFKFPEGVKDIGEISSRYLRDQKELINKKIEKEKVEWV